MQIKIIFYVLILVLASCSKNKYSRGECNELQIAGTDGNDESLIEFEAHCKAFNQKHTIDCGTAIADHKAGEGGNYLLKTYGEEVLNCFKKSEQKKVFSNEAENMKIEPEESPESVE